MLDASADENLVGAAEVALVDAVEGAVDGTGRKAVLFGPLIDGFALAAQPGLEALDGHDWPPGRLSREQRRYRFAGEVAAVCE